ncbi:MAG TPA: PTS sugar transporter subunit IIB [Ruminococcaceae bacterium]|jgi:PTS system cellobiose-specific IIB component|nr:PTS sugar transporter subunit IIB [Oscillospiraceae bacterium]
MKKILLFCSAGMSTSLMVTKMRKAAEKKNIDVTIDAFPEAEMAKHLDGTDVVLLGPQIRYAYKRAQKLCEPKNIPVALINSVDYGMMDGEKVLDFAMSLI